MNKRIKIGFLVVLLILGISFSGFAQMQALSTLQSGVAAFSKTLAESLPFNSTLGLNWSDAYIGQLLGVPPHFGVGISLGFTTMDLPIIKEMASLLGYSLPINIGKLIFPAYTAEGRIGGFILPFDVGLKVGYLPPVGLFDFDINYLLVGADIRYALLEGNVILPKISFGVGINYFSGGIGHNIGGTKNFNTGGGTVTVNGPDLNLKWDTTSLDFKAQISKSFLIITPYLGIGGSYAWSSAGYELKGNISPTDVLAIKSFFPNIDVDENGMSSMINDSAFSFRLFGGFSINLTVFKIDFTGLYNFRDTNFGGSLGFRFQL